MNQLPNMELRFQSENVCDENKKCLMLFVALDTVVGSKTESGGYCTHPTVHPERMHTDVSDR